MDEEVLYPVCPYRNVPAAFARFHGRDSGGIARFFSQDHLRFLDGLSAVAPSIWLSARLCGAGLARACNRWMTHPQLPLLLSPQPIGALRARWLAREALTRASALASRPREYRRAVARVWRDWTVQPQLPLLPGPPALACSY